MECEECGEKTTMPYECSFCGKNYCSEHRLPENHSCMGLSSYEKNIRKEGKLYKGSNKEKTRKTGITSKINKIKRNISLYFNNNVTFFFLTLIVIVYIFQLFTLITFGGEIHNKIFTFSTENPFYIWTWIISIFSHAPPPNFGHIFINGLVLFFFGTVLEQHIGSKRFFYLFIITGIIAGITQISIAIITNTTIRVLGASGAIMAVLGTLTILNPNLRVYLWFFIPVPLWIITIFYAIIDITALSIAGPGAGSVARLAHLSGLALGLLYGQKLKKEGISLKQKMKIGDGGPGGGGSGGKFP